MDLPLYNAFINKGQTYEEFLHDTQESKLSAEQSEAIAHQAPWQLSFHYTIISQMRNIASHMFVQAEELPDPRPIVTYHP
jgi:hypothetical protein